MNRFSLWLLTAAFSVAGCQCLVPVEQVRPGGVRIDAGRADSGVRDGGSDAGPEVECEEASDCAGAALRVNWCALSSDGGSAFSCVQGRCVSQCSNQAGRTCTLGDAECLRCETGAACPAPACSVAALTLTLHVEQIDCDGAAPLQVGDEVTYGQVNTDGGEELCEVQVRQGSTVVARAVSRTGVELAFRSELLGGVCIGQDLPTGAFRVQLDCPRCMVVLGP